MEYFELVRRALAVPSIIQEQNRTNATAQRLRQRAGLPNAEGAVDLAGRVVTATIQALEAGDLDPMFGGYAELNEVTLLVLELLPDTLPERETRHTVEMLLTAIKHYADTHDDLE